MNILLNIEHGMMMYGNYIIVILMLYSVHRGIHQQTEYNRVDEFELFQFSFILVTIIIY